MIISFFEEYPTKENLKKLRLITWHSKLYIASKSLNEFNKIKSKIKNNNIKEMIYWPILAKKEGYWISPFSKRKPLFKILNEIKNIPVMIDAELPTTQNPILYITQLLNFSKNKKFIKNFILNNKSVYVAEYCTNSRILEMKLSVLGLHFDPNKFNNKVIKMIYHSMHNYSDRNITDILKAGRKRFKDKFIAAFGTIAVGVKKNEPKLSLKILKKDLDTAKNEGIKEVIIYRLGGLNKEYAELLKQY